MEENKPKMMGITQNYFEALTLLVSFYGQYLARCADASPERSEQRAEVQRLLVKLQNLSATKIAMLSLREVGHMEAAISTYITQAKAKIAASKSREEILENCEQLQAYFAGLLTTPNPELSL